MARFLYTLETPRTLGAASWSEVRQIASSDDLATFAAKHPGAHISLAQDSGNENLLGVAAFAGEKTVGPAGFWTSEGPSAAGVSAAGNRRGLWAGVVLVGIFLIWRH